MDLLVLALLWPWWGEPSFFREEGASRDEEPSRPAAGKEASALDFLGVVSAHGDFVWESLQRLGVRSADLDDMEQEVFLVVHRRLPSYDGSVALTTWIFGICRKVAAGYRRRAYLRREQGGVEPRDLDRIDERSDPERAVAEREARRRLASVLDALDDDKRAVFVMFEVDGMSCDEIATQLGIPVGTVHSRLHAARRAFVRRLARMEASDERGRGRG